jgi:hypothetical protein
MSVVRLAVGAHFFTDVLLGALSSILVLLAMHRLIFGPLMTFDVLRGASGGRLGAPRHGLA